MNSKELTPEDFFVLKNGGKSPEASFNDNETFTGYEMINFAKEYAAKTVEEYKAKTENFIKAVVELHPVINVGNDKELKLYNALHELRSLNQNPDK